MKKVLGIVLLVLLGLITAAWLVFRFSGDPMAQSPQAIADFFETHGVQHTMTTYTSEGRQMHYVSAGADTLPTVLFIHGSPGAWDAYLRYFGDTALTRRFRLISVDRAGYGQSDPPKAEPSMALQTRRLAPVLATVPGGVPLIVVGHSYGGPVAARLAMEYPDRVSGLLLLAGIFDPKLESRFWVQRPLLSPALDWLLAPIMRTSNEEMVPLRSQLEAMLPLWPRIRACTIIIQGDKDMLVKPGNADFAASHIVQAPVSVVRLPDENHFIVWSQQELIVRSILEIAAHIGAV
ncbi:MAG: alpha/beta fold hydrolase [Bacteroidia bacterium]